MIPGIGDTQNITYIIKRSTTAVTAVNLYISLDVLQAIIIWRELVYGFFDTIPSKFFNFWRAHGEHVFCDFSRRRPDRKGLVKSFFNLNS